MDTEEEVHTAAVEVTHPWAEGREVAAAGQTVRLSCEASGAPAPQYRWLHQAGTTGLVLRAEGPDLLLDAVGYSDAGSYYCEASNLVGGQREVVVSEAVEVEVRGPPVLTRPARQVVVQEGEQLQLAAHFCSHPRPALSWTRPGRVTPQQSGAPDWAGLCSTARLVVGRAGLGDAGQYRLQLENEHGVSSAVITVLVVERTLLTVETGVGVTAGAALTLILLAFAVSRCCRRPPAGPGKDVESCGTGSTTSDNIKNERLDQSEEEMVFTQSYERLQPDLLPGEPRCGAGQPAFRQLCRFPVSANCGSMRLSPVSGVEEMLSSYNSNILQHINTINYSNYNSGDNIYHWRKTVDPALQT